YQVMPKVSHLHAVKRIFRLISWQCKKQTVVVNFTTEAEYVAASSYCGQCLSPKTTAWNEFSSTMASAIICLETNQKFNFSKLIFDSMIRNLDNVSGKFLMYPRHKNLGSLKERTLGYLSLVILLKVLRAAATASSLEAEQDSGNINKTQSKATPNESSSQGTNSGGGTRCQETIGDTIAQTRFENVSKHSNNLLLARGNTLQSDEDRLKLDELMALCTTLQNRVLYLEKTKTTQHNEIASLKRRANKLEKKNRSRTHRLKRLYKGRNNDINADDDITLVSVHDELEVDEEVVEVIKIAKQIINAAQVSAAGDKVSNASAATTVSAATTTTATTVDDITLAQALEEMKNTKPK
ncbi:hypothetical protein Tco_0608235, partial [Tanacetum coccineum]